MRLGQTSAFVFGSKIVTSAVGFLATLYFARELGADVLGLYFLILAIVSWLQLIGEMGLGGALTKRLSETDERGAYLTSGGLLLAALALVTIVAIVLLEPYLQSYVGHPDAAIFLLALVGTGLLFGYVSPALRGQHLVHVAAGLETARALLRAVLQVAAVASGLGLVGLVAGWTAATAIAAIAGLVLALRELHRSGDGLATPTRDHVESLLEYAKYSWLGGISGRSFNWVDLLVLGFFVQSGLIGVYAVAWNVASFLRIFGSSIQTTLFPELSKRSAQADTEQIATLVTQSLTFSGLIIVPGLVGGVLLGERLLRLYGPEFTIGTTVLGLLILAVLIYDYQNQLGNALNAMDRPDLTFRVNAAFIVTNVVLNVALIWQYSWIGAAVATVLSAVVGLGGTLYYLRQLLSFELPLAQIARQWVAAGVMAGVVSALLWIEATYHVVGHNAIVVLTTVGLGAGVYFLVLFAISDPFRVVVRENLPVDLPVLP